MLRWVGGKTRLLPELVARMPKRYGTYYEPFVGGGALFFRLAPERAVLADANADLILFYETVRADVEALIGLLEGHRTKHSKAYYYQIREDYNARTISDRESTSRYKYLNATCFNGLWRVNKSGAFNVPMGDLKTPNICDVAALRAASLTLREVELRHEDFLVSTCDAMAGDFVYFDPPYVPLNPTSNFTTYTADGFGLEQQRELAATAFDLVERGVQVMLSNSDTPIVRELYRDFRIDTVRCGRSINSNGARRGAVNELIITGGYDY